ncbi:hypothetical protein HAX54_023069 [Datura stramonium]|uniref:Uncharacterized protein n=1 Tax=Datura stramonium TaxID=4076 RepID=A0ABS8UVW8_DATST|nr:hypothetical protein [Datura stramonium]
MALTTLVNFPKRNKWRISVFTGYGACFIIRERRKFFSLLTTELNYKSGVGVVEDVMFRHASDSRVDGNQPGDELSLIPSRSSPFNFWATKVPMDRQVSDGPSRQPSLTPEIQSVLFKVDRVDDGLSSDR